MREIFKSIDKEYFLQALAECAETLEIKQCDAKKLFKDKHFILGRCFMGDAVSGNLPAILTDKKLLDALGMLAISITTNYPRELKALYSKAK